MRRECFMDRLMNEPVELPGCPELVVTRGFCYQFLKELGYPLQGGFGSVDYMTFRRSAVNRPLSDLTEPFAVNVLARIRAEIGGQ